MKIKSGSRSSSAFDSAEGVGARLPANCREPAAKPVQAVYQVQPSRLILLPLRARSSECGPEQARSYSFGVNQQQA
ncbi:hypothetical protein, partial [Pseudomonas sp. NFACC02]|uniref:hypothetical protein n=1 Tax=Pseudomonas sp. NFACC02 TaxID=1566250 RepID=UPI001C4737FE